MCFLISTKPNHIYLNKRILIKLINKFYLFFIILYIVYTYSELYYGVIKWTKENMLL